MRIRYLITPLDDDTYEILFERTDESPSQPPRAYTIGNVLSAWRAAERQLQRLEPADPEWAAVTAEVEYFKSEYRRLVSVSNSKETVFGS